jgi:uncharacterized protein (DUF433 family)
MSIDLITSHPEILGGTPCLRGTRLTVYAVAARARAGETPRDILEGYPDLQLDAVAAALDYVAENPFEEVSNGRPWRSQVAIAFIELQPLPADYMVNRVLELSFSDGIRPYLLPEG